MIMITFDLSISKAAQQTKHSQQKRNDDTSKSVQTEHTETFRSSSCALSAVKILSHTVDDRMLTQTKTATARDFLLTEAALMSNVLESCQI